MAKKGSVKEPMSKTQVMSEIAEATGLSRKQVSGVFEELTNVIERHVKKGAAGMFTLPGLLKIKCVTRPARKAQKGVPNPFKPGELMDVPARPATRRVKVLALKKLKDYAA
jgi:nucleoid DNA-binding protein